MAVQDEFVAAARLTSAFYAWEQRGRGWQVWPYAVDIEPPFRPFRFTASAPQSAVDDGRKPSIFSAILDRWFDRSLDEQSVVDTSEINEPEPAPASRVSIATIQVALPPDVKITADIAEHFLLSLSTCAAPVSYEVVATSDAITVQFACAEQDSDHVIEQLRAHFPDAVCSIGDDAFESRGRILTESNALVVDFGLSEEFMRPLRTLARFDADPLVAVAGALSDLEGHEIAALQVMFRATRSPWSQSVLRSVTDWNGEALFADAPELVAFAKDKVQRPLFAASVRVATCSTDRARQWQLAKRLGGALAQLSHPSSNELIALSNDDYPQYEHIEDIVNRQTHRSGIILNSEELVTLVHPPSTSVRAQRLARGQRRTKAAPKALNGDAVVLGRNTHAGITRDVGLTIDQRLRHLHLVGASGTGKSTLLMNLVLQDMERGTGIAVVDPHGDLVDELLHRIPDSRMDDVILIDPADSEHPVGFNILSAHSELEKTLLSSDLVSVFRRLSTSWGDQMTSVLSNAVLAYLESDRGGTLSDLRRFLIETDYRKEFLRSVRDPEVVYYWLKEFPMLTGRPQAPLLTRLDTFLRPRLVRAMMTQSENRLDFASIMNQGKILLVKLSQGAIGEENAALLGTLFVAKFHQLALGRQALDQSERRPFFIYMDEFQHFVTPSMATMLTGARKYGVGLVLAHQELRQLLNQDRDVAGAVLANAAARVCFRVGDDDAKKLEDGFTSFSARDLQNLGVGQAVGRIEKAEWDFSLDTSPLPAQPADAAERLTAVVALSRRKFAGRSPVEHRVEQPELVSAPPPRVESVAMMTTPTTLPRARSTEAPTPGRGGSQHKYLQELIKRWADANGWKATIEKPILDGLGSVDILLERDETTVACEIGVSSTPDHELQNVQKCLSAGFNCVVSVIPEVRKLRKMSELLETLSQEGHSQAFARSPEDLFDLLNAFGNQQQPQSTSVRGYRVSVGKTPTRSAADSAKRGALAKVVANALSRLRS